MRPERDDLIRDKVRRLMGVLRQVAVARHPPVRHTSRYEAALWLDDVADHCAIRDPEGPGGELLRVDRTPGEAEPAPPVRLAGWVHRAADSDAVPEPELRARRATADGDELLDDVPEVRAADAGRTSVRGCTTTGTLPPTACSAGSLGAVGGVRGRRRPDHPASHRCARREGPHRARRHLSRSRSAKGAAAKR